MSPLEFLVHEALHDMLEDCAEIPAGSYDVDVDVDYSSGAVVGKLTLTFPE